MASLRFELTVELEDGSTYDVVADQRDMARWEVQDFGGPVADWKAKTFTFQRFIAWSSATRQQLTKLTWPEFDAQCVCVEATDQEEPADAQDPGQTAP